MKVIVYEKTGCPWASAVRDFLKERDIPFEARDMVSNPAYKKEIEKKSGQSKSPTVEIDGEIIPDAGVEDVEEFLEKHRVS